MKAQRIAEVFDCGSFDANLALLIIRGRVDPAKHPRRFPRTVEWAQSCHFPPRKRELKLTALDELLRTHGVEAIQPEGAWVDRYYGSCVASYLNTGDTYAPTLLLDHEVERWKLTSWGDFLEAWEARQVGENEED